jgi:hypothetical protein
MAEAVASGEPIENVDGQLTSSDAGCGGNDATCPIPVQAAAGPTVGAEGAAALSAAGRDLKIATDLGYIAAFNGMAIAFADGRGVEKDAEKAGNLYVEYFNRVMACCWEPSARRLLADEPRHDSKAVRRVVAEFTRWSAALGSEASRLLMAELIANGTLATQDPLPPATVTDLPPWLKD